MARESPQATRAYADYVALGPARSLEALVERYRSGTIPAQTRRLTTLKQWSRAHGWQGRLRALAEEARAEAEARQAAEVRAILEEGYALAHERVRLLKELSARLAAELAGGRLWLHERRSVRVGSAQYAVYDLERPNAAWVEQLRGLLDDIARETGGRAKRSELSGRDGGPIEVADVGLTDAELADRVLGVLARGRAPGAEPPPGD